MRSRVALLVLALAVAGCGGSTAPASPASSPTATTEASTSSPTATPAATAIPPGSITPFQPGVDWPGFGYDDANSLRVSDPQIDRAGVAAGLEVAWAYRGAAVTGTPAIADGIAYFGDWDGVLHAVRMSDGVELWATERERRRDIITGSALVTESRVFVADLAGSLHAVDRQTGALVWSVVLEPDISTGAIFSSPVEADGRIIIGTVSMPPDRGGTHGFLGSVVALDAWTGAEAWRVAVGSAEPGSGTAIGIWSSAAVDRGRGLVYVGTGNTNRGDPTDSLGNALLAIDYRTGNVAWLYRFVNDRVDTDVDVGAAPNLFTVDGRDLVGVGCKCGDYAALDRETGQLVWRTSLTPGGPPGGVMTTSAFDEDAVYVHSYDFTHDPATEHVFSLDLRDGSVRWQRVFENADWAAPGRVLVNGVLFQGTTEALVALDIETGDVLWQQSPGGPIGGGVSVSSGYVLVGYNDGWDFEPPARGGLVAYRVAGRLAASP